jgi:uncharacterized membrane protein
VNAAFEATLTPNQRHLAHRLESFGDVVFGFTISQLALQFPLPMHPRDLVNNWYGYVTYTVTFTAIAILWLSYHRILSSTYVPTPIDLIFTFGFLAFTGLVPYAMFAYLHFNSSLEAARYGFGAYLICAIGVTLTGTVVRARSYRRGAAYLDDDERRVTFRRLVINALLLPVFGMVLAFDYFGDLQVAWSLFFIIPVVSVIARRSIRSGPTWPAT